MNDFDALLRQVERTAGRRMETPRDFDWLAERILQRKLCPVSASTLKRTWGYIGGGSPSRATLNALAQFAGYTDYETFCGGSVAVQSNIIMNRHLRAEELDPGRRIKLTWPPDRVCIVEYLGYRRFRVVAAENTKLSVGDTFSCQFFIEHEPLFIDQLIHEGNNPTAYVAGYEGGIMFEEL